MFFVKHLIVAVYIYYVMKKFELTKCILLLIYSITPLYLYADFQIHIYEIKISYN